MAHTGNQIMNGWFSEICPMWPGMALSVEIEKTLVSTASPYQQIDLYQTRSYGKMLVLDGIIQLTERDEFAYHEMMAHVPLFAHPCPERVLVIGGGDGGTLREAARHKEIRILDICEIDGMVIDISKQYLPEVACGFDDPRVCVHIRDGNLFLDEHPDTYDVIIVDSSDPIGPGEALFEKPFYEKLKRALKPGGLVAAQGESVFIHQETVSRLFSIVKSLFDTRAYASITVPSYPGGTIGICLGSLGVALTQPSRTIPDAMQKHLKYYSEQVHKAAFALPRFAKTLLEQS
ncbi:MAG: polyamine aminopropyltransferase [Desulfobacteraceae bacterium]|nr:MAG: polyamine aminopropyltransferase [Desulfobacteraceae bacterium]